MKTRNLILFLSLLSLTACEGGGAGGGAGGGGESPAIASLAQTPVVAPSPACQGEAFVGRWKDTGFAPGSTPTFDVMTIASDCEIQSSFCGTWYQHDVKIEVRDRPDPTNQIQHIRITQPNPAPSACLQPGTWDCDLVVMSPGGLLRVAISCNGALPLGHAWFTF